MKHAVQINAKSEQEFSKYLSYILRHKPEDIGLSLKDNGWVNTSELISAINTYSKWEINLDILIHVVNTDEKKRYEFYQNNENIRACQGHSIKDLLMNYTVTEPPEVLWHGTSVNNYELIKKSGFIKSMSRQYVHLSDNIETAIKVGKRHGNAIVLKIDSKKAYTDGMKFMISNNGIWLASDIDIKYIIEEVHTQ